MISKEPLLGKVRDVLVGSNPLDPYRVVRPPGVEPQAMDDHVVVHRSGRTRSQCVFSADIVAPDSDSAPLQ